MDYSARFLLRSAKFVLGNGRRTVHAAAVVQGVMGDPADADNRINAYIITTNTDFYMDEQRGKLCICDPDNGHLLDDGGAANGCNSPASCCIDAVA